VVAQNVPNLDYVCMNWLEFSANIIDNVFSWPVAVLLIVFLLRKQLRELVRTVENLVVEAGGTRVSINRSLERAREGVAAAKSDKEFEVREEDEYLLKQYSYMSELAQNSPSYVVTIAWERFIEEQVRHLAHDKDLPPGDTMPLLNELKSRGIVPDAIVDSVRNLSRVNFQVAFAEKDPSPKEAQAYAQIAAEVSRYLNSLRGEDTKPQPHP
jgi:hypothetical protein